VKKMLKSHEFVVTLAFIVMVVVIGAVNPVFYSIGNIFSLLKSAERSALVFMAILMGILVVLFLLGNYLFPHT